MPRTIEKIYKISKVKQWVDKNPNNSKQNQFTTSPEEFKKWNKLALNVLLTNLKDGTAGVLIDWTNNPQNCVIWVSASNKEKYLEELKEINATFNCGDRLWGENKMTSSLDWFSHVGCNPSGDLVFNHTFVIVWLEKFFSSYETFYVKNWEEIFRMVFSTTVYFSELNPLFPLIKQELGEIKKNDDLAKMADILNPVTILPLLQAIKASQDRLEKKNTELQVETPDFSVINKPITEINNVVNNITKSLEELRQKQVIYNVENTEKLNELEKLFEQVPSVNDLEEIVKKVAEVSETVKTIKMPDLDKLKANLQKIDNGQSKWGKLQHNCSRRRQKDYWDHWLTANQDQTSWVRS